MDSPKPRGRKKREKPATSKVNKALSRRQKPADMDPEFMTDAELARREAFAQAYVAHGIYSKAAETAGFTGCNASLRKTGWRLINEPAVKARIDQIRADKLLVLGITQDAVLGEIARAAFFDIGHCFDAAGNLLPAPQIPLNTRRALTAYEIEEKTIGYGEDAMTIVQRKVKGPNKDGAIEKLREFTGLKGGPSGEDLTLASFIEAFNTGLARSMARALPAPVIEGQATVVKESPQSMRQKFLAQAARKDKHGKPTDHE